MSALYSLEQGNPFNLSYTPMGPHSPLRDPLRPPLVVASASYARGNLVVEWGGLLPPLAPLW